MVVLSLRPKRASSRNVPKCEERGEMAVLRGLLRGTCSLFNTCYNQLQKHLRHCTVFWLEWLVLHLVFVIPSPTLIKVASNTRPCSKLGGTTLNGREEGGQYYISQTCDQQRFEARNVVFSWKCLSIFATGWL